MLMVHSAMAAMTGAGAQVGDPYRGAAIILDFKGVGNSGAPLYQSDGVTYASAASMGFVGSGTFDANGYNPAGGGLVKSLALPAEWVVLVRFKNPASPASNTIWMQDAPNRKLLGATSGSNYQTLPTTPQVPRPKSAAAVGVSGGIVKASYDGGPIQAGAAVTSSTGAANFIIGAGVVGGLWQAPIELLSIHKGTLSDAEIMGLSQ